jgi:serine/threonine-protein kinase
VPAEGSDQITKKICVYCNNEYSHGETVCPDDGTALTSLAQNSLIGSVLGGRYEIESKLGSGAMGEVYKAKHRLMKRQVAIKVLHPQTISGTNALKRFQKEAEMASALNHPNILAVHDFGVADDGSPYLVMNYLEGKSLTDLIEHNGHLEVTRAIYIFRQLCQGLGHAHEKGVIHRDLKPSNIMLVTLDQDQDFVQILDFGIAKQLSQEDGSSDSLTRTGEVFGSPHYMSPEQCRALPVDARSDIYALGCVMYRLLTGFPPIMGGDLVECLYKHVNQMPEPFSEIAPELNLPEDVEAVVFKAVAKKPEDRYQSMAELKLALEQTEAYKIDIATKTYGSLSGLKASATLTSLPASATISYGGQADDISTATSAAATAVSANVIKAASESAAKPRASQTGDLPAMQAAALSAHSESSTIITGVGEGESHSKESGTASGASPSGTASAAAGANNTGKGAPSAGGTSGAKGLLAKLVALGEGPQSRKKIIIAAVAAAVLVVGGLVIGLSPKGNAKVLALENEARDLKEKGQYGAAEQKVREAINEGKKQSLPDSDSCLYLLGEIQYGEADYTNAQNSLESALKLRTARDGPTSKEVAEVQCLLGMTLTAEGSYRRAEQLLQQSYQTRKALTGDGSTLVANSLSGLGYLHVREHNYQKAISEHTNALRIMQAATGLDSPQASANMCDLGEAYQWNNNFPQAEALYKQALEIRKKRLPPNSPSIADVLKRLAMVSLSEGNLMQAKSYFEQALAIQVKTLDAASPQLAQTRQDLASVTARLGGRRRR